MRPEDLAIGERVRHPGYGTGKVVALTEQTADILFDDGTKRTVSPAGSGLAPHEPEAEISGLTVPLRKLMEEVAEEVIRMMGVENPHATDKLMLPRWKGGMLSLVPKDPGLQSKEVPLEAFFHKIVMMRNQLRVLEQKINAHTVLSDEEKVDLQQYITRCYGSMTTFNVLFREKEDQFGGNK